jgi:thiamine biosynthesis lipoprotein ApbE
MTATKTTTRVRSELGERIERRVSAAAVARAAGSVARLTTALLGPSSPPSGPERVRNEVEPVPRHEWRTTVFGYRAYVGLVGPHPSVLDDARTHLADLERRWSPDGRDSEVARLNRDRGVAMAVSPDTLLLAGLAGRQGQPWAGLRQRDVLVDARHGVVGLSGDGPWRVTALAAALAADLVVTDMIEAGADGACVRIGTAVRAEGTSPRGAGWLTTAPRARTGTPGAVLRLCQGAVVTARRSLSDPGRDDRPMAVSVVTDHAWRAQTLVTDALAEPAPRARALLAGTATAACLIGPDGRPHTVGRSSDFEVD